MILFSLPEYGQETGTHVHVQNYSKKYDSYSKVKQNWMRISMDPRGVTVTHLYIPAFENKCGIAEKGVTETWQNTGVAG
jgi:hypothetical protein